MTSGLSLRFRKSFAGFTALCSAAAVIFGIVVLAGWTFRVQILTTFFPGQVAVKANTGLCFVLIGIALWIVRKTEAEGSRTWRWVASVLSVSVSLIGLMSFLQYWFGWDLKIDQWLIKVGPEDAFGSVRPGLMSPISALSFMLLGLAAPLLDAKKWRLASISQILSLSGAVTCSFGILDFVIDLRTVHTYVALPTAVLLFLLSLAFVSARTDRGLGRLLSSTTSGGTVSRRLFPASIVVPIVIGWMRSKGVEIGLYSDWVGIAIMVVSAGTLMAAITCWTALVIDRIDVDRVHAMESVRGLASVVASSNDAIVQESLDGIVLTWNPGAEAIYGYTAEEMENQPVTKMIPDDRVDEFLGIMQRLAQGERVRHFETVRRRKDGNIIHVSLSLSPTRDKAGSMLGVTTIARDISERKHAEEELRRAGRYTRNLIEASLDPLVTISRDGKIMDVNRATEEATGVVRERLVGSDFSEYFTDPSKARQGYERVFADEKVRDYPLEIRNTNGSRVDVLYNATVFRDENGTIEGVFAAARDVTERKRAELALQQSETRYRSLVAATTQIVWTTNADGQVIEDMPLWRQFTGMSREQVMGAGWLDSLHPDDRLRTAGIWADAWRTRSLYDTEYRIRRHDGVYRMFSVRGVPVREPDGGIREWIGTCTDITERKLAEEEVRRLNEELEQRVIQRTAQLEAANKELEAFTYSVSHDLRAPLRHISGFTKILVEDFGSSLPPDAQHHLQRIEEGTHRMGQLVDDLLNLGRVGRQDVRLQVTGLRSLVDETVTALAPDCASRQVEWKIGDLPYVECDAALMKQVFQNLMSNALKFTRPRPCAVIEIGQTAINGEAAIYVRDNGVGFSMKYADKLFGVFQRLHRVEDFEGTGVGLATVQRIIEKHGGRIWADAVLDQGATFYFTLVKPEVRELNASVAQASAGS